MTEAGGKKPNTEEKSGDFGLSSIPILGSITNSNTEFHVECGTLYEEFSKCMSPGEQVHHIHRYGQAKDCSIFFDDWKKCLYSRMTNDSQKIKELYESTYYFQEKQQPVNDVFVYKTKPSWD